MPDHDAPRPGGWRSGDALNAFTTEQRQLFRRIAATDVTELPRLLDDLPDRDLQAVQRMTGAAAHKNWALKHAVGAAVLRRPHRGCWPT